MVLTSPDGTANKLILNCGCKINLRLKVTGKRPDKLHTLSSCFLFLEHPGDTLEFSHCAGPGIFFDCPGFPELCGEKNLVYRAAALYAEKAGLAPAWKIVLHKHVPLAAGLGGGSAGAGGILSLLNSIYHSFTPEELNAVAFSLGADVPFFLHRRAAWVTGAGEFFEEIPELPPIPEILIVNPGFPVSAKWAYTRMAEELKTPDDAKFKEEFISGKISSWSDFCRNDLAPALYEKFPLLVMMRSCLEELGALAVQVSGSGSSLFALFEKDVPEKAAAFRRKFSNLENLRIFAKGTEL